MNTYGVIALDEEFVHRVLYRSDACRVMLRLHTQRNRWRSCRTITANRYFSSTVWFPFFISTFYCLPVLYFLIHFCVFLVICVFSVVYLYLFPGLFNLFLYYFRYIPWPHPPVNCVRAWPFVLHLRIPIFVCLLSFSYSFFTSDFKSSI